MEIKDLKQQIRDLTDEIAILKVDEFNDVSEELFDLIGVIQTQEWLSSWV